MENDQLRIVLKGFGKEPEKRQTFTVDCTPTWAGLMPGIIAALDSGTPQGRAMATRELTQLAENVDKMNAASKAEQEALKDARVVTVRLTFDGSECGDMAATKRHFRLWRRSLQFRKLGTTMKLPFKRKTPEPKPLDPELSARFALAQTQATDRRRGGYCDPNENRLIAAVDVADSLNW